MSGSFIDKLYGDIGKKLKSLAVGVFIVEAIASFITGIVMIADDDDLIGLAFLVMLLGPVVAWISSWMLYAFGELVDKACDIEKNTRGSNKSQKKQNKNTQAPINPSVNTHTPINQPVIKKQTSNKQQTVNPQQQNIEFTSNPKYTDFPCPHCNTMLYVDENTTIVRCPFCNTPL